MIAAIQQQISALVFPIFRHSEPLNNELPAASIAGMRAQFQP
jgi:hypothetical protein